MFRPPRPAAVDFSALGTLLLALPFAHWALATGLLGILLGTHGPYPDLVFVFGIFLWVALPFLGLFVSILVFRSRNPVVRGVAIGWWLVNAFVLVLRGELVFGALAVFLLVLGTFLLFFGRGVDRWYLQLVESPAG
ncbi:MAG: hypothetical protein VX899_23005 [Myxococcota bacterium]|nr:hypothetical protein [Myxococcota bacterium]